MRWTFAALLIAATTSGCAHAPAQIATSDGPPPMVLGTFEDDYDIRYTISEREWFQHPRARYRIVRWNRQGQYLIAQNDAANPGEGGRWSRIDWMPLSGMRPFTWGYCLSAFDAPSADAAEATTTARREDPRTGCNGFPFSRMRVVSGKLPPRSFRVAEVSKRPRR